MSVFKFDVPDSTLDEIVSEVVRRVKHEMRAVPQTKCPTGPESWRIMMATWDDHGNNRAVANISEHPTRELAVARVNALRSIFHEYNHRISFYLVWEDQ